MGQFIEARPRVRGHRLSAEILPAQPLSLGRSYHLPNRIASPAQVKTFTSIIIAGNFPLSCNAIGYLPGIEKDAMIAQRYGRQFLITTAARHMMSALAPQLYIIVRQLMAEKAKMRQRAPRRRPRLCRDDMI